MSLKSHTITRSPCSVALVPKMLLVSLCKSAVASQESDPCGLPPTLPVERDPLSFASPRVLPLDFSPGGCSAGQTESTGDKQHRR